ncbi:MerR family transcriptional regulator [Nocardioides sp. LMS-CY]|uniref:DNA-binding transcriptional MerR regulator n=1 Tax=Nocardioides soli TaxID=1036020 RepID=A0A7W4VUH6_9ACTN|nr:MerR family transcriptional regulator [Nocardioides sp. LMS-CY]MBB3041594.1 DNA-binding transcriptional MerR regulator [Nocardioides soli]QWF21126.1 MerR family transcriptional regulator [Nocardioides sp. LMS-CY]
MSYSIAEVAELTDLTPDTLRYYERDGLMLHPVDRSATGHRRYTDGDLTWINLLTCLRGTGMPIRDVRRYAELVRSGEGTEQARLDLLRAHRVQVLARLAEVQEHLGAIDRKIGIYSAKLEALDLERTPGASVDT